MERTSNTSLESGAWGSVGYGSSNLSLGTNLSTSQLLELMLGPRQVHMSVLLPITVIYALLFLTGVAGNVAVCVVILRNRAMHSATNYYLCSLAISDLVILSFGLPTELIGFWHQYPYLHGEIFCKLRSFVSEMASYSSVLTLVSFSFERYLAICHPLHFFEMPDLPRVLRVLAVSWTLAGVSAVPHLMFTRINYVDWPVGSGQLLPDSAFCALLDINIEPKGLPMHELSSLLFFAIPVCILLYLYVCMAISLKTSLAKAAVDMHADNAVLKSRRQIIRMLSVVVIAFFVCWAPFHAQRLGYVYFKESLVFRTINEYLMYVSGITYYISSTINPILYNVMSTKYRQAFKNTLCSCGNQPQRQQLTLSHYSQQQRRPRDQARDSVDGLTSLPTVTLTNVNGITSHRRQATPHPHARPRLYLDNMQDQLRQEQLSPSKLEQV